MDTEREKDCVWVIGQNCPFEFESQRQISHIDNSQKNVRKKVEKANEQEKNEVKFEGETLLFS